MAYKVGIKKQNVPEDIASLHNYTKEELIERIRTLSAHNTQLKNIIAKSNNHVSCYRNKKDFDFSKCNFRHILLKVFYLGWDYKGYVTQEDTTNTIEHHLFNALTRVKLIEDRSSSNYHRCGRTDKGVSSLGQTISIDVRSNLAKENQDDLSKEINYCKLLNKVLPDNIQCVAWSPVDDSISARFDCKKRTYKYFFPKGNLNIEKMRLASKKLSGTHDFRNFCKMDVGNGVVEFTRNIFSVSIEPVNTQTAEDAYTIFAFSLEGNAFLWHQIRCILGIMFLIGQDKEETSIIDELLDVQKNPRKPEYYMASEVPLNLFHCEYDNVAWHYDAESLNEVMEKLNSLWTFTAIKESMIKEMLDCLNRHQISEDEDPKCLSECLIQGIRSKKYKPVMKRQLCNSLEDKIEHFKKRNRIEIVNDKS